MKRLIKLSFVLLALMGVMFTSCKKDYPDPIINPLPVGTVFTIDSILKMDSGTIFDTASVYGVVTADEKSGNLYKAAFIQDPETNAAIELYMNAKSGLTIGDYIRVYLKDVKYEVYNGLPQLSGFEPDGHIVILANDREVKPIKTSISELKANKDKYVAHLIRLENVWFTEKGTFAASTGYGEHCLVDAENPTGNTNFIVRTSNYANFANDPLPSDTGNLVAIASYYKSTWQLIVRSLKDVEFGVFVPGGGGGSGGGGGAAGEVQTVPYMQSFATEFGTYTTFDVAGSESWMIDFKTAKMTGYVGGVNNADEDWLISSPVDLTGVSDAKMTMSYIGRYFNKINEDITIWASTDYKFKDNPTTATWTQVPATLQEASNWETFLTAEIALTQFVGQTVTFAVKYLSTEQKAGTIEIQSIAIEEGTGVGPTPGPGPSGEVQSMPYAQSFETEFGSYITKDVSGPQSWVIDFKTAKMTGYAGSSNANEDWLISSPVAVVGVENAKVSVTYAAQYQNSNPNDVSLQVSTDYVFGNDPGTATWTDMAATYPNTASFKDFQTVETSLNDFIGQNVFVAIKYTSTDSQSRTIEIQSITIQEGSGSTPPGPTPGPTPGTPGGSGTQEDPYNVASGIENQGTQASHSVAWVQGYIVGSVKAGNTSVTSNDHINWAAPFDLATNVLIADDPTCNEISQCVFVNLPAGKPLRTQVNLMDHPENLGKLLSVNGKLYAYFGKAGLRSDGTESDFVLEGGGTPTPTPTPTPGDAIFSETFANGQGDFEIKDVVLPSDLTYVWIHDSSRKHMKASAFKNPTAYEAESWLVSPAIDLSGVTAATLSFEQAVNYASPTGALSVMISTNYTGNVAEDSWTELEMSAWPAGSDWTFITSTADLTPYVGQTVTIAFKYTSTASASCTWEVKNVVVE